MTWFRCGGGSGMPADLKNRMNAVFNKKFGTAIDYPAEGWPDDVNLMGPLPEKTIVSSPIADFSDGADDVPTKSLVVTISPTLSGVSSVTETQTGKTIFYPMDIEQGSISGSGYNSDSIYRIRTAERKAVTPSTEYKIKVNSEVQIYEVHEYTDLTGSSTHLTVNASEYTFTTKSTTNYLKILFRYSNNATITPSAITELQVTDGELYWETYTASLGRTIYGGEVDIVNGEGADSGVKYTLDGTQAVTMFSTTDPNVKRFSVSIPSDSITTTTDRTDIISDVLPTTTNAITSAGGKGIHYRTNGSHNVIVCFGADVSLSSEAEFNAYVSEHNIEIVYTLATPTDFTFDGQEIKTRLGYNAFWSDQGDTEVTYRADISLALQAVSNSRGLMMASRPAIEPANGDQGSEESTENNIETEGEEDAR